MTPPMENAGTLADPGVVVEVESLAGVDGHEMPVEPFEGFVRCGNDVTGGVADLPVEALGLYASKGWHPVDAAPVEAPAAEIAAPVEAPAAEIAAPGPDAAPVEDSPAN
jgi:hypothetical protein